MKIFLVVLFVSLSSYLSNFLYGQGKDIHINRFLYQDSVLFEDIWDKPRGQQSKDRILIDTLSYLSTCILENEKDSLLIYLSEKMSLHFVSLHTRTRGINLYTVRNIETPEGYFYFPSKILCLYLRSDEIFHIISVFNDAEGPIFKINIYEWNSIIDTVAIVFESKYYFSYPSWNPTIEKEEIKVKNNKIYIPYCEGCESGVDGILKWDTLVYDDGFVLVK